MHVTDAVPGPAFARREAPHLRYGRLKKAYDAAAGHPGILAPDGAPTRRGAGRNMVHAMRFWSPACKVPEPSRCPATPRRGPASVTPPGSRT